MFVFSLLVLLLSPGEGFQPSSFSLQHTISRNVPGLRSADQQDQDNLDESTVIQRMFEVAEMMSRPPTGGVTLQAFATLPPISVLSGDRDEDLSEAELRECWADGSLGTTRVEREGFGRVWKEVSDYFEGDIMEEARKTAAKALKKKRTSTENEVMKVGETMSAAEIQNASDAVKQLSGDDMDIMLDRMENMGALEESRLKGMGVDPTMMKKAAEMMKGNPMMKNAAQTLMKNMSPEQMMKASEQAQSQLKGMSTEDMEEAMNKMKDSGK